MLEDIDPDKIKDPHARQCVVTLLNLAESHLEQIRLLKEQIQFLRDEIARLKGQQGKPSVKPNKPAADHSSEAHRRLPTPWHKKPKRDLIEVAHTCETLLDLVNLPKDKRCWDTFMTLSATAAKLGVDFYHYLNDRLSEAGEIPSLAALIRERAEHLNLGASWEAA